jgi:transcriptional regulator with XRE-family HTH domain
MGATSLRHLRHSSGLSQAKFSDLLGLSVDHVRALEQGRFEVSDNVARAAFVATGAIPALLKLPDSLYPEALAWDRTPYTPDHFAAWQRLTSGDLLRTLGGTDDQRFPAIVAAFFDAAKATGKLGTFQALLALALHDAAFDLGTQGATRALAHERGHGAAFDFLAGVAGRLNS